MSDADDALQSAFISFWQRAERGDFGEVMTRDDLWNVLGTITVRKALRQQRHELAQKRGGGRTREEMDLHESVSTADSPEFEVVCAEMLEPDLRSYALLRLMGHKNREIADHFGCTERKVERKLQLIRAVWDQEVAHWTE